MTPASGQPEAGGRSGSLGSPLASVVVLGLQAALVAVIYYPTRRLAFVSDAWVYLQRLDQGFWRAVATPIGYHWQPVAVVWVALLRAIIGDRPAVFQAVNLAQLTLLGYLTYQLGRRLFADRSIGFLASLLVIGSAAFYEATYWSLAGNMHLVASLLYVLAVIVAYDHGSGRWPRVGPWLLGLVLLAAVFSHPAMITAIPVCALTLVLAPRQQGPADRPSRMRGGLVAVGAVVLLFAVARVAFDAYMHLAPKPGFEAIRIYWLVTRGIVAVFSLRGSHDAVARLLTLGTQTGFGTAGMWAFVAGWLAIAIGAGLLVLWRSRSLGPRLLVLFLAIHLGGVAYAGGMSPRQSVLPTVPAALLVVWALRAAADRLASRGEALAGVCRELPAVAVLLLVAFAQPDHRTAADLHTRASDASRRIVDGVRALVPPDGAIEVTLVNCPGAYVGRGIGALAFANGGIVELIQLTARNVRRVELRRLPSPSAPEHTIPGMEVLGPSMLRERLEDPRHVVLIYEEPSGVRRLALEDFETFTPPSASEKASGTRSPTPPGEARPGSRTMPPAPARDRAAARTPRAHSAPPPQ